MSAFESAKEELKKDEEETPEGPASSEGNLDYEDWNGIDVIEGTLCLECGGTGRTMLMLHKIPFFRELIIGSFKCNSCNARNNEVTFGGEIQPRGARMELTCTKASDLNRQLIKSDSASVIIPELEFEIPPGTQKGEISTVEGILRQAASALGVHQKERMMQMPEVGAKVQLVIMNLIRYADGDVLPFHVVVDDCSGNSFIENPEAPKTDPHLTTTQYLRTPEQNESLGLSAANESEVLEADKKDGNFAAMLDRPFGAAEGNGNQANEPKVAPYPTYETEDSVRLGKDEVVEIPDSCPNCGKMGAFKSAMTSIPHFKEVLIMAFNCAFCGYRSNEVKGGGAIPAKGMRLELIVSGPQDLKRDCLKGDSAALSIPSLDLELSQGSLGGVYTTIEGLLNKVYTNLRDNNPFAVGDSITKHHSELESTNKKEFVAFLDRLKYLSSGNADSFPFQLVLTDPLANSFISAPLGSFLPPEADENLNLVDYERTQEECDEFGISDMNTRDFETIEDSGMTADEYYNPQKILPDRLTHVIPKGQDHPLPFAQGVQDGTAGGRIFGTPKEPEEPRAVPEGYSAGSVAFQGMEDFPQSLRIDGGSKAMEPKSSVIDHETYGKRHFNDDSSLEDRFEAREEFAGRREGYVFRLGSLGLGYYPDTGAARAA